MKAKWLLLVIGGAVLGTVVVLVATTFLDLDGRHKERLTDRIGILEKRVTAADRLWDDDKRFEAVKEYRAILRAKEHYQLHEDLPILYRRVIEHEAEYGDPSECRDWCFRAYEEWPGMRMKLTFTSETATKIWNEVTAASEE